jgi:hypothetical protein
LRQLQFRNNEGVYILDDFWSFDLSDFGRRLDLSSRYSKNGSNAYGDRTTDARQAAFRRQLTSENDQENIQFLLDIERFFDVSNAPFFFEDLQNNRRAAIEVASFGAMPSSRGTRKRFENVQLDVIFLDGEYEDLIENVETDTLANDGQVIITNPGRTTYPVISLTANGLIGAFELRNLTNSTGLLMSLTNFDINDEIIINAKNGEILLNDVDVTANVVDGGPLILGLGTNIIRYNTDDASVDIEIRWRNVTAF